MNIPKARGYSIWLMFEKSDELELQLIIDQLSSEFNSISFKPHLTLLPGIEHKENLMEKFSTLLSEINKFDLVVKDINLSEEFYKSVFLEVEKSEPLVELFSKANELFKAKKELSEFIPHISLLYSDLPADIKKAIADGYRNFKSRKFSVDKVSLVLTEGIPSEWEEIISVQLQSKIK